MLRRIAKSAISVWIAVCLLTPLAVYAQTDRVDTVVKEAMVRRHIPSASVAVVREGKIVFAKGYGVSNVEAMRRASADTVYQLASVTKQFTATAIMLLVEEGKLTLDDKITARLTGLPDAWSGVTVRHLLNHTSGIVSYTSVPAFHTNPSKAVTPSEIVALVANLLLEFPPGTRWNYNNTGYYLLGMLLEKTTGKPYGDYLAERIFKPLGMTRTRLNDLRQIIPDRAVGYSWESGKLQNGEMVSPTQPFSAGALVSTVLDMAKWDSALYGERILKKASLEAMWQPTTLKSGKVENYGFGWGTSTQNGQRVVEHGGGIQGFSTHIVRVLDAKTTVIVLTNLDSGNAGSLAQDITRIYLPALKPKPEPILADTNPTQTARLKEVLLEAIQGRLNPDYFDPEAVRFLAAPVRDAKGEMQAMGALKAFQLLGRQPSGEGLAVRYRVQFEKQRVVIGFVLNKAGKVMGMMLSPASD